jgi:hypothetical protein
MSLAAWVLALSVSCSLACDNRARVADRGEVVPAPIASLARIAGFDAADVEPRVDPAASAGDLKADLDAFVSVDACVAARAHVDPLVGDALEAIGYDTLFQDTCRVLGAAKSHDPRLCDAIEVSALRIHCRAVVAQIAGDADGCPWLLPTRPALGRDPTCLGIALGDARMCSAASDALARETCAAIVRGDGAACSSLTSHADQARCERDAERWRTVTHSGPRAGSVPSPPTTGKLVVEGSDGAPPIASDSGLDVTRGVVLLEQRNGTRLVLGNLQEGPGPDFLASSLHSGPTFAVQMDVNERGEVRIDRAELLLPGRPVIRASIAHPTLKAEVEKWERERGGNVKLSIDGELSDASAHWRVRAMATTFVRDIVKAAALYAPSTRGDIGADRGMR